ncbi:MAG: TIGR00282 family metallophosphoesterase [Clostridia bacterium]|nr:TIGR00282 family metallophosphoesterase [Clostridia bacterium]MDD4572277.1 TIGR00282 family metallophosphoesterase [Clostridia bacterium]
MKILFVGDISGSPGRKMLEHVLAKVQWEHNIDFTVVNGENSAGGTGIHSKAYNLFMDLGIDAITMGNHTWDNKDIFNIIAKSERLIRPYNLPENTPGRGYTVLPCGDKKVAVVNLLGRVYIGIPPADCPFRAMDKLIKEIEQITPYIIVDFHAEATSEKIALAYYLDGRVSAVLGTHTHVQTNDARILPRGTAYITDTGMTGPRDSCLGVDTAPIIERFLTGRPTRFHVAAGPEQIFNAVVVDLAESGSAKEIYALNIEDTLI